VPWPEEASGASGTGDMPDGPGARQPGADAQRASVPGGCDLGAIRGSNFDEFRPEQTAALPLLGSIVAGPPLEAEAWDCIQYARVLAHQGKGNRYVLRVRGTSMWPELKPEDLVLVENRENVDVRDVLGKICAVMLNGEATLKRIAAPPADDPDVLVELHSENPEMAPIQVREADELRILGVAVEVVSRRL
jgi:SOS-response transcriptional repressor LexA